MWPLPPEFSKEKTELRRFAASVSPHVTPGMRREPGAPFQQQSVPLPHRASTVGPTASPLSVLTWDLRQGRRPTRCSDSEMSFGQEGKCSGGW